MFVLLLGTLIFALYLTNNLVDVYYLFFLVHEDISCFFYQPSDLNYLVPPSNLAAIPPQQLLNDLYFWPMQAVSFLYFYSELIFRLCIVCYAKLQYSMSSLHGTLPSKNVISKQKKIDYSLKPDKNINL